MLTFDFSAFEKRAREFQAQVDQVPQAIAWSLNEASKVARTSLIDETWPKHVEVRNAGFLNQALRTEYANKRKLRVSIYEKPNTARLAQHAHGGVKRAQGGMLAIPTARVKRTPTGRVQSSQKPGNLKRKVVKGGLIFQAEGRGKNSRLRLMFKLQPSARQPADVPFEAEFARVMRREVFRQLPAQIERAMATRLPRR